MFDLFDLTYRAPKERNLWHTDLAALRYRGDPRSPNFWGSLTATSTEEKKSPFSAKTIEIDGKYFDEIRLVAPGLKREDFDVDVENDIITVSYQLELQRDYEFASRSASSSYRLPEGVVAEDIKARYEDGILYVRVPVPEKTAPTKERTKVEIE